MNPRIKIYTKTGDKGTTSLIGGKRVLKNHPRIEAYGTIDELLSYIGLIRDMEVGEQVGKVLVSIQDRLMICASELATVPESKRTNLPSIKAEDIEMLENEIDRMDEALPPLKSFILPGGHMAVSFCHIARTVCRRSERRAIELSQEVEIDENVLKFINRLSDYLFTLSRSLSKKFDSIELPWNPML